MLEFPSFQFFLMTWKTKQALCPYKNLKGVKPIKASGASCTANTTGSNHLSHFQAASRTNLGIIFFKGLIKPFDQPICLQMVNAGPVDLIHNNLSGFLSEPELGRWPGKCLRNTACGTASGYCVTLCTSPSRLVKWFPWAVLYIGLVRSMKFFLCVGPRLTEVFSASWITS